MYAVQSLANVPSFADVSAKSELAVIAEGEPCTSPLPRLLLMISGRIYLPLHLAEHRFLSFFLYLIIVIVLSSAGSPAFCIYSSVCLYTFGLLEAKKRLKPIATRLLRSAIPNLLVIRQFGSVKHHELFGPDGARRSLVNFFNELELSWTHRLPSVNVKYP